MKKFYELYGKYEWLELDGDIIRNVNCTCEDFTYRRLEVIENKVRAKSLCKHLKKIIGRFYSKYKIKLGGYKMAEEQPEEEQSEEEKKEE